MLLLLLIWHLIWMLNIGTASRVASLLTLAINRRHVISIFFFFSIIRSSSFFRRFSLLFTFCHKISPLLAFEKKLSLSPQNTKFLLFFSLSRRTTDYREGRQITTERESFVIYHCLIKHVLYTYTIMSSTPNVPSPPPSDPFAPNPPPVPGILITKVRFLNRFLKREKERETNNRNV